MTASLIKHRLPTSGLLLFGLSAAPLLAQDISAPPPAAGDDAAADVSVVVTSTPIVPLESIGSTTVSGASVGALSSADGDINEIARTMPNVQFSAEEGLLDEDSIKDISPARISISGGRFYENNFIVEGLSTNSILDQTTTNYYHYEDIVLHPQTTFVSPSLIDSVTVMDSNISARYGGFTGGVVEAKIKDPTPEYHVNLGFGYTSDVLTSYKVDDEDRSDDMPERTRYTKRSYDLNLTTPLYKDKTALLLGYSLTQAQIYNSQYYSTAFGEGSFPTESQEETFLAKVKHTFDATAALTFTSMYTKYYFEEFAQSEKIQHNDGLLNKLEFEKKWDRLTLKSYVGYQTNDDEREDEPTKYIYINYGTENTAWVPASASTAQIGGYGDREAGQTDLPLGFSADWQLVENGHLSFGADYTHTKAYNRRKEDVYWYTNRSTSKALDPLAVSADGDDDPTVIAGEQGLDRMYLYPTFDATVEINKADAWTEWNHEGTLWGMPWNYRAGLRYDTDDFLDNHNLAPRLTAMLKPVDRVSVFAGYNRYYAHEMAAYALEEQSPDIYIYYRTYTTNAAGQHVYSSDDWYLGLHSTTTKYSQADLDTPYANEFSAGFIVDLGTFGSFTTKYLDKKMRDEFAQEVAYESVVMVDPVLGETSTYRVYNVTNNGWTDYESLVLSWQKKLQRHRFEINATFSDTKTGNENYFDAYDDAEYDELVAYNGALVTRREIALVRANYARPLYVNFIWDSSWLQDRLLLTLVGRWNQAYDYTESNGTTTIDGTKYDLYEDVRKPQNVIFNLAATLKGPTTRLGEMSFTVKVENLFDRLPNTEASTTAPYQEGTTVWLGVNYSL